MNAMQRETDLTVAQFLAWEDRQDGRHEFDGVRIIPSTGGSRAHQRIILNLMRLLDDLLAPDAFEAVPELRLNLGGKVRYPDISVCVGRIADATRTLHGAVVVFEVLSPDTASIDRREKRGEYQGLPGLRQYVMVDQTQALVTVVERSGDGWTETDSTEAAVPLVCVGVTLPIQAIYAGIRFA